MTDPAETIRSNLMRVQERIAEAANRSHRPCDEITLVGVTKYVDAAPTDLLIKAGCLDLGESRPQSLWRKASDPILSESSPRWRLIGHLQRNKVERTVGAVTSIDSVDSARLLGVIETAAAKLGKTIDALLEINCSGDREKQGFSAQGVESVVERLGDYPHVRVRGLMTMAARQGGIETARRNFQSLREVRDRLLEVAPPGLEFNELSMGMSNDFEAAIAEGSTLVRIGSALWEGIARRD